MPTFADVFSVKHSDRKLTHNELVRAVRINIAAEYEAVQMYAQLAESIDNEIAKAVLEDVAREEIVHAGEFLRLLRELEPDEQEMYEEGFREVEDVIGKHRQPLPVG